MRPTTKQLLSLGLLAATLPLATDAGAPVPPASRTPACLTSDAPPQPVPDSKDLGDEKFFSTPGGVPNVMILLDTSGSMRDLPNDIPFPSATGGTCTAPGYDEIVKKRTATPFDNGFDTGLTKDDPVWGLAKCTKAARPPGDNAGDACLFRGDSYYKSTGNRIIGTITTPKVFNANPCAAVDADGDAIFDGAGTWVKPSNVAECTSCLATAGYYLFRVSYRDSRNRTQTVNQAVFKGDFLNANPPKYVSARKVVKDLAKLDPGDARPTDKVRLGLTIFTASGNASGYTNGLRTEDGGRLMVPLGPNCTDAYPPTQANYQVPRQALVDAVNTTGTVDFNAATPLAETLFNIGQYFADSTRFSNNFGAAWTRSSFAQTSAGLINASWVGAPGKLQASFCWRCQQSSVVIVTDGEPNNDSNLPKSPTPVAHSVFNWEFRSWSNPIIDCPDCGNDLSGSPANALHKVASFLATNDLRLDFPDVPQAQVVKTYTISFGIDRSLDPKAIAVLQKTADLGNGLFKNTSSGEELGTALNEAVTDVEQKNTSFSSANANSLQTNRTEAADTYVGRFKPTDSGQWEGHLFATELFDEFARNCDGRFATADQPTIKCGARTNPNINGNETPDGKANCNDVFLVDQDCDPVVENAKSGVYMKGSFDATSKELIPSLDEANVFWDAGRVLSDPGKPGYRSAQAGQANSRQLWTTIDVNSDGLLTAADGTIELIPDNAAALAPFMSLDKESCVPLMVAASLCGASPLPACPAGAALTAAEQAKCATLVINYVRGYDVLDSDGDHCAGPGGYYNKPPISWATCGTDANCGGGAACVTGKCVTKDCTEDGEQRDRIRDSRSAEDAKQLWKLGDIFHSSPTLVRPPTDKLLCTLGLYNQCVITLFSPPNTLATPTPLDPAGPGLDAYDLWRKANSRRTQLVLVGANDGLLHAFHAGEPDFSKPALFDGTQPYTSGSGAELWGYVPPDILPRLKTMLQAHQYSVDGTTMARDVWVDFNNDGKKQASEFRTVAIIQERGGGIRRTALDVTVPERPVFLWTFPQNCSEDSLLAGQSWGDFLPRAPPVGPVRLKARPGDPDPTGRGWLERWVVMLNGGYDPALVRGRVVWMLDVWTGQKVWQYSDADFKAMRGDTKASMFPVAAVIGMSDVGDLDTLVGRSQVDYYFDTATWGDLGGNVFLARFHAPGQRDPVTGLVTNWPAARTFEQQRQADDRQRATGRSQYFFMTQNINRQPYGLRVALGSGNRAALMNERPTCGPDDIFGCAQAGCSSVTTSGTKNYGAGGCNASLGTFTSTAGVLSFTPGATAGCNGTFGAPGPVESRTDVAASCGSGGTLPAVTGRTTCDAAGLPRPPPNDDLQLSTTLTFTPASANPCVPNRFVSFWAYGVVVDNKRMPEDEKTGTIPLSAVRAFEANRFSDVSLAACNGLPSNECKLVETSNAWVTLNARGSLAEACLDGATRCRATLADPGWMYTYGKFCPEGPGKCATPPPWCDERTASQGLGASNCFIWAGFRPAGTTGDICSKTAGTPTSYQYFADFISGVPTKSNDAGVICGVPDDRSNPTVLARGTQKAAFSAPQSPAITLAINERGEVSKKGQTTDSGGTSAVDLGTRSSLTETLYWLEVPRQVHTCRHVDPSSCK